MFSPGTPTLAGPFGHAEVPMPSYLGIAFSGMMVGGAAFLIAGTAVYLTTAQLQYSSIARLQDRTVRKPNSRIASSRRKGLRNRPGCSTHDSNLRSDPPVSCLAGSSNAPFARLEMLTADRP
jgi:hypothetical protein